eukprot:COSAG02_NODE_762_length_17464_cov_12.006219_7_plen_114_part_00
MDAKARHSDKHAGDGRERERRTGTGIATGQTGIARRLRSRTARHRCSLTGTGAAAVACSRAVACVVQKHSRWLARYRTQTVNHRCITVTIVRSPSNQKLVVSAAINQHSPYPL